MTNTLIRSAAAVLAAASLAAPSFAADSFEFDFQYDRSAAQTTEGARAIYSALETEVTDHCKVTGYPAEALNRLVTQRCVDRTLDRAVKSIDTSAMDAIHAGAQG